MSDLSQSRPEEESAVRAVVENWAAAVRRKDVVAILANHSQDFLMFDVPPPFSSRGIDEYRGTWDLFYSAATDPVVFDIEKMEIAAGSDVAFVAAFMRCRHIDRGIPTDLDFRLTVGLRKIAGQWAIMHEHHSVPATQ
ncbi:MAG TPA: nuclear transport factor 2 family protein [Rhizomicrobium sp.]|nr:nuclear transport factor 2 family protein [Rhizomicrobium sp.]